MLDRTFIEKENAIEEIVYDFLKERRLVEMSNEISEAFLSVAMIPNGTKIAKEDKFFIYQVMEQRVEHCFTFKITDDRVYLTLSLWADGVGTTILYLWYIQGWCFHNNIKEVDFQILCMKIFPFGIFSEKDLKEVWDKQKVDKGGDFGSDNLVDYNKAGSSIQFKN